jgi:hypothetical protein
MAYFKLRARLPGGGTLTTFVESNGHFADGRLGRTMTGVKVDREGTRVHPLHVVIADEADVLSLTPYEMDRHYGELVPASERGA